MIYRALIMKLIAVMLALYASVAQANDSQSQGIVIPKDPLEFSSTLTSNATPEERKSAVLKDMGKALVFCRGILNRYEKKANATSYWLLGVAVVGTIAGGVIVPALSAKATASKSAIAAWGGLSGMANATQSMLSSENLDSSSILATRHKVAYAVGDVLTAFLGESSVEKQQGLVLKMYSVCIANDIINDSTNNNSNAN